MKFTISGKSVPVFRKHQCAQDDDLLGCYDIIEKHIIIGEEVSGQEYLKTLLHEFLHAVFYLNHFGQTSIGDDVQELLIEHFVENLIDNFDIRPK